MYYCSTAVALCGVDTATHCLVEEVPEWVVDVAQGFCLNTAFCCAQVYILLDAAWDKYNTCCKEYEAAGQNIDTLLATNMNKLFTSVAQSTSNYRTTSYGSGYGRRR